MLDHQLLTRLVLEVLKADPSTQFVHIVNEVEGLAARDGVLPTKEGLNPLDAANIKQVLWDLIVDRVLTPGSGSGDEGWPFVRLTDFGQSVVDQDAPNQYDPEGYVEAIEAAVPDLDSIIRQYVLEGLSCFRQRLYFASAVMFGAAAEKAVLLLLQAIASAETDQQRHFQIEGLLDQPRLPTIYQTIRETMDRLIAAKAIPYSIHQGSTEHLLSLFEAIRVQRNDSVHPAAGHVERQKVWLTVQSMPAALEQVYGLIQWFGSTEIGQDTSPYRMRHTKG